MEEVLHLRHFPKNFHVAASDCQRMAVACVVHHVDDSQEMLEHARVDFGFALRAVAVDNIVGMVLALQGLSVV